MRGSWLKDARHLRSTYQFHRQQQHTAALSTPSSRHVLVFPGQGSQRVGAGLDIVRAFPYVKHVYDEADEALGMPLSQLIWNGQQTDVAQPAILTHSLAVWLVLCRELGYNSAADVCSTAMGHSLGEFSALCVAGSVSFTDAVRLVRRRGQVMRDCVQPDSTAMAALLPCTPSLAQQLCERAAADTGGVCVLANINTASQMVIAGHITAVQRAIELGKAGTGDERVKRAVLLDVSAPFHCPLMQPARDAMVAEIAALTLKRPCVPIVSNVTALPVSEPEELRALMAQHFTSPVQWYRSAHSIAWSVLHCLQAGVDEYTELGPSSVLAGLVTNVHQHTQSTQPPLPAPAAITTHALCTADNLQQYIAKRQGRQTSGG